MVTGASGFLGQRVVPLLARDNADVLAVVRPETSGRSRQFLAAIPRTTVVTDTPGSGSLESALRNFDPTGCIHLAAYFERNVAERGLGPTMLGNIEFGVRMVRLLETVADNRQEPLPLVFSSTRFQTTLQSETHPYSPYVSAKRIFSEVLQQYSRHKSLRVVDIEICDTCDGDDRRLPEKLWPRLKEAAENGRTFEVSAHRSQELELLHATDAAGALIHGLRVAEALEAGYNRFHIECHRSTIAEAIEIFGQQYARLDVSWRAGVNMPDRALRPSTPRLPGWQRQVDLPTALRTVKLGVNSALEPQTEVSTGGERTVQGGPQPSFDSLS